MNTYLAIVEHTVSVAICLVKHRAAEGGIRLCLHQAEMSRFISCVPMIRLGGAWRDVCYGAATAQQQSKTISFVVWSASVFVLGVCVQARTTDTHTHTHTHTHTTGVSKSQKNSPTDGVELGLVLLFCLWSKLLTDIVLGLLTGSIICV